MDTFVKMSTVPNPKDPSVKQSEPLCRLTFGEVAIPPFVILHARLGDERFPACQSAHHIRQILMGLALKRVADGEWRVFRDRQSIGRGKLRANVATCVAFLLGMTFKPQKETFF